MILHLLIVLLVSCLYRSIWGFAVDSVIKNKGYSEDWFWWGFLGGLIVLIVALTRPNCRNNGYPDEEDIYQASRNNQSKARAASEQGWTCRNCGKENAIYIAICSCGNPKPSRQYDKQHTQLILEAGGWRCSCGKINAVYVGTCSCGATKTTQESTKNTADHTEDNWLCVQCGRDNAPYIGTCACGMSKSAALEKRIQEDAETKKQEYSDT